MAAALRVSISGRTIGVDVTVGVVVWVGVAVIVGVSVGVLVMVGVSVAVGVLVELGARKLIQGKLDALAAKVPLLGGVYGTVRQLVGMMDKSQNADLQGMTVVFCNFGQTSGASFLALLASPQAFRIGELDYQAVIIPTAPVPVGGSLIFVPTASIQPANITVDAFMSIYVSMGVTGPQFLAASVPATVQEPP